MPGTCNSTWDSVNVGEFLNLASLKHPMKSLFWSVLEHDTETAKDLAKEVEGLEPELVERLEEFKEVYLKLRRILLKVTKKSEKF